jgi:hypothetical protein
VQDNRQFNRFQVYDREISLCMSLTWLIPLAYNPNDEFDPIRCKPAINRSNPFYRCSVKAHRRLYSPDSTLQQGRCSLCR